MARAKTRAANRPVPQSREEAAHLLAAIGRLQREHTRLHATLNDVIAAAKLECEYRAAPLSEGIVAATEGLRVWADANRDVLTNGGKVKTADLGTGLVKWRVKPASVKGVPRAAEKLAALIARLREMGLGRFVRTKSEIDKEAMLREPDVARGVAGLAIGSDGEEFVVEPFEAELSGGKS